MYGVYLLSIFLAPTTIINVEFAHSMDLVVSLQDNNIGQPPVNYCNITWNDNSTACQINENYTFPIIHGVNNTYNVTVGNVVGSINETGNVRVLRVPTTVFMSVTKTVTPTVTPGYSATGHPAIFPIVFAVLGVLIMLFVCWMILRICWKRQWCCPRMWSSSFWLLFFCYDCCTHNAEDKIANLRTKSPDEKDTTMSSIEMGMSQM